MKDKILFITALFLSKSYLNVLKFLGKEEDDKPGLLACKIYPNFIEKVAKPKLVIAVTGTNGKTTVTNMLGEMLIKPGNKVSYNNWGANTKAGSVRNLLDKTTIFNKNKADIALFEIDEITSSEVLPFIKPNYLIVTNLYRDSMHRNAHTDFVFDRINKAIPKETILILNADDPISSYLKEENKCIYFGIDKLDIDKESCLNIINDFVLCPKCNKEIKYIYNRFHHIGKVKCENCGFKSKEADYLITNIDYENNNMNLRYKDKDTLYPIIDDNISNIYNLLTVVTCLKELGYSDDDILSNLRNQKVVSSRFTKTKVLDKEVLTVLTKGLNAVATSRVCDYIKDIKGSISLILVLDDTFDNKNGSEAICWIYDTDFELLNTDNIKQIIIGGVRNRDYILRLLLAGIDKDKIIGVEDEQETYKYIDYENIDKIIIGHEVYYVSGAMKIKENVIKEITNRGEKHEN